MRYDYVIVGAGAAGCALAARLSEDPTAQVLLLERGGGSVRPSTIVPRAFPYALREPLLTSYPTRPGPDYWVRGVGLGGSTSVNGLMYVRGEAAAYDELEAAGNPGWGWAAFEAAYDEIENRYLRPTIAPLNPLADLLAESLSGLGAQRVADLNASTGSRVGATPASIAVGRRRSAAQAFLDPARARPNLRVLPDTTVLRLLWDGSTVRGLVARRAGQEGEIDARRVVLAAGTIETPLLLERSGVGDPERLAAAGIDARVPSPRVGEGVREQQGYGLQLRLRNGVPGARELSGAASVAAQALRYGLTRTGALARPAYDVTAILSTDGDRPDTQVLALPFGLDGGAALRPAPYPAVFLTGYQIAPSTTSSVHVDPADPHGGPVIDARYEQTDVDRAAADRVSATLRRAAETGPLGDLVAGPDGDGALTGSSIYHAVGSAAMGTGDDAVTDAELRVRGAEGLYVADLSVLPFHPSGSTAAPAMALGWLAGSRLLQNR